VNVICTLIFSDPSLGYDKNKIDFPINLKQKFPKNGSGLCNQIFKFINSIYFVNPNMNNLYIDLFCKDIHSGEMIKFSDIISISEMREKFSLNIYDITDFDYQNEKEYQIYNDLYFFRTYHTNSDAFEYIIKSIIWNSNYENISKNIIRQRGLDNKLVNLVHLRIDEDCRNHVIGDRENQSLDYDTEYWINREKAYYELISRYEKSIYENCSKDIPLVLLMEEVTHPFVQKLKEDYDVIFFDKDDVSQYGIDGRELFALIDLLIGKNLVVENYIGMENTEPTVDGVIHASSFSVVLKYLTKSKNKLMI
jgi:hypothetical protein